MRGSLETGPQAWLSASDSCCPNSSSCSSGDDGALEDDYVDDYFSTRGCSDTDSGDFFELHVVRQSEASGDSWFGGHFVRNTSGTSMHLE